MIKENLKNHRLLKGLTQRQVAEYLNISTQSISKWENGEALPSIEFLPSLAQLFDCKIDDLFAKTNDSFDDVEDIKTYFNITDKVYNKGAKHDNLVGFCREFPEVIDKTDKLCYEIHNENKINISFIQKTLNCSDEDALEILKIMEKCEILKISSDNNIYKVVKHAVEGQVYINKGLRAVIGL